MKKIFFVIFLFLPVIAMDHEQGNEPDCCQIMKVVILGFFRQFFTYPHAPRLQPLQQLPKKQPHAKKED